MRADAPRLTVLGSERLESELWATLDRIAAVTRGLVGDTRLRALVLLGGYGRGEGGVARDAAGRERPHNNFDVLLVTRADTLGLGARAETRRLGAELGEAVASIAADAGIGIDVGAVTDRALRDAPCLVMWSDMAQGHRVLAGDDAFVAALPFAPEGIEAEDVVRLLANRVTLLVVNRALLAQAEGRGASREARAAVLRHGMKAVVGVGDAWLFAEGRYDGSYLEKQRRMQASTSAPPRLRRLYDEAIRFRLAPGQTEPPPVAELRAWNETLLELAAEVHRRLEEHRLGRLGPGWEGYVPRAAVVSVRDALRARSAARVVRTARDLAKGRGLVPLLLPLVAYRASTPLAGRLLSSGADEASLDLAYLRAWSRHGDPAFLPVARRLGLTLESPKESTS